MVVFGTRPEAIKMAPVIERIRENGRFILKTVVTGQHRKMLDQVLKIFRIKPDYDMNIMLRSQPLHGIVSRCVKGLNNIYRKERPSMVLVHGDTTTTLASALAAYYSMVPVGHVEAGLRSYDPLNPFPEEQNRRLTDALSSYHFAPTAGNKENLLKENINKENIYITGNTVIDALLETAAREVGPVNRILKRLSVRKRVVLITSHRRENLGSPLISECRP